VPGHREGGQSIIPCGLLDALGVAVDLDHDAVVGRAAQVDGQYRSGVVDQPQLAVLPDPVAAVQRCKSLLADSGTIFITAPFRPKNWEDGKSTIAQWREYSYNHVPAHIQYFSRESMAKLVANVGCDLCYWNDRADDGQAFEAWLT
jgi:hypothetical protein